MTIAQPFGQATLHLGLARFNFLAANALRVSLLSPEWIPNLDDDVFRSDLSNEVTAVGYAPVTLSGVTWTYESDSNWTVLKANAPTWTPMPATVQFAVVYGNTGNESTDPLLGYVDLEEEVDLTNQGLNLAWPASGIFRTRLTGV